MASNTAFYMFRVILSSNFESAGKSSFAAASGDCSRFIESSLAVFKKSRAGQRRRDKPDPV